MILNGEIENIYYKDGVRHVKVPILADAKPDVLPTTGENVIGLLPTDIIGAGSRILTIQGDCIIHGETAWGEWL